MIEIIAELSGCHGGSLANALRLIEAAASAGATGVKFQYFNPDRLAAKRAKNPRMAAHDGIDLVSLYRETHTPVWWFPNLIDAAGKHGLTWHASAFDPLDVEVLETLDCPRYKIASFEAADRDVYMAIRATGKPVIVSVNQNDIGRLPFWSDPRRVTVLHATDYGVRPGLANLRRLREYACAGDSDAPWGLSDHTTTPLAAQIAAALGASMIEKHIKLADVKTPDDAFAVVPELFALMVGRVRAIEEAMNG